MRRHVIVHTLTALLCTSAPCMAAAQQPTVPPSPRLSAGDVRITPLQVTGDAKARFALVVLGDGYTAGEMEKFRSQVDRHLNVLWSIEPFRSYRNYINVYVVETPSQESGITCDPAHRGQRATALRLFYSDGCTNVNARGIYATDSLARFYARMATPDFDQILILANTETYGGIGGSVATTSGGNSLGVLITPHELGHSLGGLQDEYTYSARGVPGPAYTGNEPRSVHHSLLTEEQMRAGQAKWWRWLGDVSESGGKIGRVEGGQQRLTGVWRPSKHSMMISLGYYFDQVSRERMLARISRQVDLIADATPGTMLSADQVVWVNTAHPVYHELAITWRVDGRVVPNGNRNFLDLRTVQPRAARAVSVSVVDTSQFVRDPAIRDSVLTETKTWTIGGVAAAPGTAGRNFTGGTLTNRALGARDVVYVETSYGFDNVPVVTWRLDRNVIRDANMLGNTQNSRTLNLAQLNLAPGTYALEATLRDAQPSGAASATRRWIVDNTPPTVNIMLSDPDSARMLPDSTIHAFVRGSFTMDLHARDDQPGYVVAEFRVNGDGWHHFYGWPDAPPGTPFLFTPRGTTIKELVYGSLASEGLSPQPWEKREPGWGTHTIEYRAIDAAGNISTPKKFLVTITP